MYFYANGFKGELRDHVWKFFSDHFRLNSEEVNRRRHAQTATESFGIREIALYCREMSDNDNGIWELPDHNSFLEMLRRTFKLCIDSHEIAWVDSLAELGDILLPKRRRAIVDEAIQTAAVLTLAEQREGVIQATKGSHGPFAVTIAANLGCPLTDFPRVNSIEDIYAWFEKQV